MKHPAAQSARILVTGAAGYIGSILIGELLTPRPYCGPFHVTALDNFSHGENSLAAYCANYNFDIVNGDARDTNLMTNLIAAADIIIPLAAIVGAPACGSDRIAAETTNLGAIDTLYRLSSKSQQIIFPNTNSGYGTSNEICTEDTPLAPISHYGRLKARAETLIMQRENSIAFRLATVFGASPRMRTDWLVNDFVLRAVRDSALVLFEPYARRNYVHVRDVAAAFLHAIVNFEAMRGNIYNCGDTLANMDKYGLCAAIQKYMPNVYWAVNPAGADPDKRDYRVSNARLEATGWAPQHTLDDGIVELIKLYCGLNEQRYRKTQHA